MYDDGRIRDHCVSDVCIYRRIFGLWYRRKINGAFGIHGLIVLAQAWRAPGKASEASDEQY
jgi:hypothetical protein